MSISAEELKEQARETERQFLGEVLVAQAMPQSLNGTLTPEHFVVVQHRAVFAAMLARAAAKQPITLDGVSHEILQGPDRALSDNWPHFIAELSDITRLVNPAHQDERVLRIMEYAAARDTMIAADDLAQKARRSEPFDDAYQLIGEAMQRRRLLDADGPKPYAEVLKDAMAIKLIEKIETGIPGLDQHLDGGYLPGRVVVFGGYTGGGKTTFALHQAVRFSTLLFPVLFVSAELSAIECAIKILSTGAAELPLLSLYDSKRDITCIAQQIAAWSARNQDHPVRVVVLDYLQRLTHQEAQSREREVGYCCEVLQAMSRKHKLLMILAAQLNRESERDGRPLLHHFRESGLIEQVADYGLLLQKVSDDQVTVHVAKNRWGTAGAAIDLSIDWRALALGPVDEAKRWEKFSVLVCRYLKRHGGRVEVRSLIQDIKFQGRHVKKQDLVDAATETRMFAVEGSWIVQITTEV